MAILAANFIWIAATLLICGFAGIKLLKRITGYDKCALMQSLVCGIVLITFYASVFSLFGGVGPAANALLLAVTLTISLLMRKELAGFLMNLVRSRNFLIRAGFAAALLITLYPSMITMPRNYDTYLYHAQSIHWIEDYGLVPGLGNLHGRLAYNSSFFCLQALYSMRFLFGRSIHAVNAFSVWVFLCYSILSLKFWKHKKWYPSDFLKLSIIYVSFRGEAIAKISSPGTDTLWQLLIAYAVVEWVSLYEDGVDSEVPYALLSVLCVFCATMKLAAAVTALLALKPACMLVRKRDFRHLAVYLSLGILLLMPFLIRNVMISGYLVFPYPGIDLFSFDWKMNANAVLVEKQEILAWGRGINDWKKIDMTISEWVPIWWEKRIATSPVIEYLLLSHFLMVPLGTFIVVFRKKSADGLFILISMAGFVVFFLLSGPTPRFAAIYITMIPAWVAGIVICDLTSGFDQRIPTVLILSLTAFFSLYTIAKNYRIYSFTWSPVYEDYDNSFKSEEVSFDGKMTVYVPVEGDQTAYDQFPSTPYPSLLEVIEMRGDTVNKGFRPKADYRDARITNKGKPMPTP